MQKWSVLGRQRQGQGPSDTRWCEKHARCVTGQRANSVCIFTVCAISIKQHFCRWIINALHFLMSLCAKCGHNTHCDPLILLYYTLHLCFSQKFRLPAYFGNFKLRAHVNIQYYVALCPSVVSYSVLSLCINSEHGGDVTTDHCQCVIFASMWRNEK